MRKLLLLGFLVACSSSPTGNDGGTDATVDAPAADTGTKDAATDSGADAGAQVTLTLKNYFSWCNVSVNDGGISISDEVLQFPANDVVKLHSDPGNTFFWGYWVGTDQAAGDAGQDPNKTTTVTMSKDKTIQACCPDTDGGACPPP